MKRGEAAPSNRQRRFARKARELSLRRSEASPMEPPYRPLVQTKNICNYCRICYNILTILKKVKFMDKICYIIGAGDITYPHITATSDDLIICADGGYKYKALLGRVCDMVVGDFDSFGSVPDTENKIVAPTEKDETDMMLAVDYGYEKGYRNFVLLGALGGERNDHSVANIQLLHYITRKGARVAIYHGNEVFTAFSDGTLILGADLKGYVSVFSLSDESRGVTIKNLKYTVDDFTLCSYKPIGVSNEFLGIESEIEVRDGTLLVVYKKKLFKST